MGDSHLLSDLDESPENSSTLHPWTRLHGGKHREFSASRLQSRERARQRVQRAIQEERVRAREQAENWRVGRLSNFFGTVVDTPGTSVMEPEPPESLRSPAASNQDSRWLRLEVGSTISAPAAPVDPQTVSSAPAAPLPLDQARPDVQPEKTHSPVSHTKALDDEPARPAWLTPDTAEASAHPIRHAPADTLQGVRDRLASRWFALSGVFEDSISPAESAPAHVARTASPAPVLAVFSLAGGVGKSSLAATLARTLSARGERVLLVETTTYGLLPFFFGARERRPGVLRTFTPPDACCDAPVQVIAIDADSLPPEADGSDPLAAEIARHAQGASRIIVDIATASTSVARRVLRMSPQVLVPVVPDTNSVVNAGSIDSFFQRNGDVSVGSSEVCYVLNQFDSSLPLHLDVREVLRERLGDRLLPFALRRAPAVSEALAEGMTVVDYAPASPVAEDFNSLAAWTKGRSAPAGAARPGIRWIEK